MLQLLGCCFYLDDGFSDIGFTDDGKPVVGETRKI